jgi:hypothetical protein
MLLTLAFTSLVAYGLPALWREGPAQVPDAVNVFFDADDISGPIDKGVLLCRVDIVGNRGWDTFGAVDLAVTLTVGKGPPTAVRGPEDRSSAVVSLPAIDLAPGQKLKVLVEDRDVTENEFIARGAADYAGKLPLRINLDDVQVECRAVGRATAVARAKAPLAKAAHAMNAVERAVPDLSRAGLGAPDSARWDVAARIDDAAAWLGDDDASVRALVTQLDAALAAFHERARADVRALPARLPAPGATVPMSSLGVNAKLMVGPSLVVEVSVPAGSDPVLVRDDDVAAHITLLDASAKEIERPISAVPGRASDAQGVTIAPGTSRKIRMRASALPEVARVDGVLVRLR